ncbi:Hsp20/alpha crystallin family protein [Clostridium fallax]|uniref:Heat shock protein Hsp20 n=1 Tax=Clostridium fallax TaxID=1533 RepID=A0A1M4X184_9CLOT|nr:Hsp20/alpha crystallin family protein [Clostridium fallax]SHE87205.1 heat shock protein Hsp20 [Clostridium fallax]SQB22555.1 small heat shock protein [Clostridium fallax]
MLTLPKLKSYVLINSKNKFAYPLKNNLFYRKKDSIENFNFHIEDNSEYYILKAHLPNIKKENIEIYYLNNFIILSIKEIYKINYINYYKYKKSIVYINDIDFSKTICNYQNNILKLTLIKTNR